MLRNGRAQYVYYVTKIECRPTDTYVVIRLFRCVQRYVYLYLYSLVLSVRLSGTVGFFLLFLLVFILYLYLHLHLCSA